MRLKDLATGLAALAIAAPIAATAASAYELTIPSLVYRTGPYAPSGIPFANGYADYFTLLNERDGGINGAKINVVECETAYNTQQGVECYENTKNQGESGALVYQPLSTGISYQLIPKAEVDQIPIFTMGYGRTSAADGTIFPWIFNPPGTYWDLASGMVNYAAAIEGGHANLSGKTLALVYHNSAYGKEPIRTLEALAEKHGFKLELLPVDHPGQEQKATWLQIRRLRPDWVFMWGWGVMNQVAVKEAASIRFPMDRFIGNWWSGSEQDVLPTGGEANGYLSGTFHAPGPDFPLHQEILDKVYGAGKGAGEKERVGEVLYNRGLIAAVWTVEAIRKAMEIKGSNEIKASDVRDGFDQLKVDEARLAELGLPNFTYPVELSCASHSNPGTVLIQQWDAGAKKWNVIASGIQPDREVIDPLIAEDAAAYAKEANITPRECNN
ncbi:ABC transporter substrate-binding protein [Rhizobiales bacterium]|uniref:ABC transporter substrate-binding protein n=1 Tax=Hongsoonwoonella zoysiae TaxID=2821844 RepID=UPI00155FB679|nr:ABC transporter substrate-binding protein [Hongsoonwoonella zoysiae]NRG17291.1 ABC transporter substrate-binding protein [Hongsoonwoonella zoysiae]